MRKIFIEVFCISFEYVPKGFFFHRPIRQFTILLMWKGMKESLICQQRWLELWITSVYGRFFFFISKDQYVALSNKSTKECLNLNEIQRFAKLQFTAKLTEWNVHVGTCRVGLTCICNMLPVHMWMKIKQSFR